MPLGNSVAGCPHETHHGQCCHIRNKPPATWQCPGGALQGVRALHALDRAAPRPRARAFHTSVPGLGSQAQKEQDEQPRHPQPPAPHPESAVGFGCQSRCWRQTKQPLPVTFILRETWLPPVPAEQFWAQECNEHVRSGSVLPGAWAPHYGFPDGSGPARGPSPASWPKPAADAAALGSCL